MPRTKKPAGTPAATQESGLMSFLFNAMLALARGNEVAERLVIGAADEFNRRMAEINDRA